MNHLIIYHAHCNDGFGAAWAAWKALKETGLVELHAASYGKEPPANLITEDVNVHIVDFSYPPEAMIAICGWANSVTWLDHHKTAIEAWAQFGVLDDFPVNLMAKLDTEYAGAMLAWNHYHPGKQPPRIIEHIQDRDLWQFLFPYTKEVHLNLNTIPKELPMWDELIASTNASGFAFKEFVAGGSAIKRYYEQLIENILATNKQGITLGTGQWGLSCNCPGALASDLGHQLANESGTFGLTWELIKDGNVKCSLRSNADYDVSAIAKQYGGGGHKNAAGFIVSAKVFFTGEFLDI